MSLDPIITADLAALGEDNRRNLPALDGKGVYRDDRPGAEARRNALSDQRRLELATMPLVLAHVFAHRIGRAVAGAAALACTVGLVLFASDPTLVHMLAWFVPGLPLNFTTCAAAALVIVLAAYVIGNWVGELWLERKLRAGFDPTGDPYRDLDRLAEGPLATAHQLVERADPWAVGLFLGGMLSLASMFGYLLVTLGAFHRLSFVLSSNALFVDRTVTSNLGPALFGIASGVALATYVGYACRRERSLVTAPRILRWFGHWAMLPLGTFVGLFTLYRVFVMADRLFTRGMLPGIEERLDLSIASELSLVMLAAWAVLWWRRREHARIGQ